MAVEVTDIQVHSFDLDHLDIFWKLNEFTDHLIEEYDFYILRSIDGFAGPYSLLAGPFHNTYTYRDVDVHRLHKWRNFFYRIRVVHRDSGDEHEYGPAHVAAPPDKIALEIQRRESLVFSEFNGRNVVIFPRLTFGQRCSSCWDMGERGNSIYRTTAEKCPVCYDTSFVGGYAKPMLIPMQIDPSPHSDQVMDVTTLQIQNTTARTTAYPPINSGDLIVERENTRWVVEHVSKTEKGRAVLRQELRLRGYPKDSIQYAIPISLEGDFLASPERGYTRLMSIQDSRPAPEPDKLLDTIWKSVL